MKTRALMAIALLAVGGCMTEPKIESTKPWEGHVYTVEELKSKTEGMQLENGESIWIMSNHTLNRLLKNIGR